MDEILEKRAQALAELCEECPQKPYVDACWWSSPPCKVGVVRKLLEENRQLEDALDGLATEVWCHMAFGTELPFAHVSSGLVERALRHKGEHGRSIWLALALTRATDFLAESHNDHSLKKSPDFWLGKFLGSGKAEEYREFLERIRKEGADGRP